MMVAVLSRCYRWRTRFPENLALWWDGKPKLGRSSEQGRPLAQPLLRDGAAGGTNGVRNVDRLRALLRGKPESRWLHSVRSNPERVGPDLFLVPVREAGDALRTFGFLSPSGRT